MSAPEGASEPGLREPEQVARRLAFTVQPSGAETTAAITPDIQVAARDSAGNVVTGFQGAVTLAIDVNPSGGRLSGSTTRNAVAGIATFAGLSIDRAGRGYRLAASASGLERATSAPFDIRARPEEYILAAVSGNGQSDTVAATLASEYVVRVTDSSANGVAGVTITWAVTAGGGTVSSATTQTDTAGRASVRHTLGTTAGSQVVTASAQVSGSPITFTSTATHAAPARIVVTQQPTDSRPGGTIAPPVQARAEDQFGNVATGFADTFTISITPSTGTPLAKLSGTLSQSPTDGAVTFSGLSIDLPGLDYRLRIIAGSLLVDTDPFDVL